MMLSFVLLEPWGPVGGFVREFDESIVAYASNLELRSKWGFRPE